MPQLPIIYETIDENNKKIKELIKHVDYYNKNQHLGWLKNQLFNENNALISVPIETSFYEISFKLNYKFTQNQRDIFDKLVIKHPLKKIDIGSIRDVHAYLTKGTIIPGGQYRDTNSKMFGVDIKIPEYQIIPDEMIKIIDYLNSPNIPIISKALNVHYKIIATQPFVDYNKRTARMIMNSILSANGFTPIIFNHSEDRTNYLNALENYRKNHKEYKKFMLSKMIRTQNDIIRILERQNYI